MVWYYTRKGVDSFRKQAVSEVKMANDSKHENGLQYMEKLENARLPFSSLDRINSFEI